MQNSRLLKNAFGSMLVCLMTATSALAQNQAVVINDSNVKDFPRLEGEVADSARIQRAIEAAPRGVVTIPAGVYKIDKTIDVNNAASLNMHKSARFEAVAKMDFMLNYDGKVGIGKKENHPEEHNWFIIGGDFGCKGLSSGVLLRNYHHFTFKDTTIRNATMYGFKVNDDKRKGSGYELIATNLYFRCDMKGLAGNIGICTDDGDSHYTDCVVIDYTTGIYVRHGGSNRLTRCHVWGGPVREMLKDSVCFRIAGGDTLLRDCYADTGMTGFLIEGSARVLGCAYYNNWGFKMDNPTVFDQTGGRLIVSEGFFTKTSPSARLYKGTGNIIWRDNIVNRFKKDELGIEIADFESSVVKTQVYEFENPTKPNNQN